MTGRPDATFVNIALIRTDGGTQPRNAVYDDDQVKVGA